MSYAYGSLKMLRTNQCADACITLMNSKPGTFWPQARVCLHGFLKSHSCGYACVCVPPKPLITSRFFIC